MSGYWPGEHGNVQAWVEENRGRLPDRYDDFCAYPMPYRRAIFAELSPAQRSGLWVEQLARYRAQHPDLTAEKRRVLGRAEELLGDESLFAEPRTGPAPELDRLKEEAIAVFGFAEAFALIANLGPVDSSGR